MFLPILILLVLPVASISKMLHLTIRENVTQTCPHMKSDVIDRSSVKMSFELISGEDDADQATITDVYGESKTISFPACYRARLSFRMKRIIKNPYVEAFLQLGQNIPCQASGGRRLSGTETICANITRTNWCPKSNNQQLRSMLTDKQTCTFCHMCESIDWESKEAQTARRYFINEGEQDKCDVEQDVQTLTFKICTPSRDELNERDDKEREEMEKYWHYLKQGVLTAVVHVLDREEVEGSKRSQCQQLCDTYENRKGVSLSYKKSLLKSIEGMCGPQDTYAACVYHTVKFDINENL
ncbi:unnamed protein product [Auanema sp. JU1783]|nr:unnamed protein product [Auanema sp. JU1783]